MKKLVSIIIMAAMVFAFSSCTAVTPTPAASAQPAEATPIAEESAQPEETAPVESAAPAETTAPAASVEDETAALNAVLDEISTDVQPGSAGSTLKSAKVAADLLNWATKTTLDDTQIKDIVVAWMSPKGNDVQVEFARAMEFVYESYKSLISEGSADLVESAGLEYEEGAWGFEPVPAVETIADAVGIEK